MATQYVENFADQLYAALRKGVKERRGSIAWGKDSLGQAKCFGPNPDGKEKLSGESPIKIDSASGPRIVG
jgi:hypothetical protein